ncbi:SagB family peptide dehydrogenase [Paenibacillus chartarius]|uniref:SagB family peptide dehydrogenase n=1 Tax=Paenibacillus chartarius TaxID=747481 RepID=A0ABV6DT01_9BACL
MNLDAFVHHLHASAHESGPSGWEVDWADAPLPYKLYRGLPAIPLSPEVPLTLLGKSGPTFPDITGIGHFLWYIFGLARLNQTYQTANGWGGKASPQQLIRRFVPSGGGLYPSEVYIYLKLNDAPPGVYHYDVAHHRLVLLREGNFDSYLSRALGGRCDLSACFGTVFVSTVFWKNFFKYHHFAYRLQGLDAGVLIGQLLEVAKRFEFDVGVHYQFLDRAVNHLLGISDREESVYAVIPLSESGATAWNPGGDGGLGVGHVSAAMLCKELSVLRHEHYVRSRRVKDYSQLIRMNEASMQHSPDSFRQVGAKKLATSGIRAAYLPEVPQESYDLASVCRSRYSPESEFVLTKVPLPQLSALLQEAAASCTYRNDLNGRRGKSGPRVSLYGSFYGIEGLPDGAYRYESSDHSLRQILRGDHRVRLQLGMFLHNLNLFQIPICLHVAGDKNHLIPELGYRGYRIQQMEAGILVQQLLLASAAKGMGGRPLLGFHAGYCDELYKLGKIGDTTLIQLPVGAYRQRAYLEGGLHG